jgi:threonine aldolase
MHDVVDLRSDTLTLPTQAMRDAMARAEVGDDVWEEDPTVRRLEDTAARRTGKEAALFVSSGTQGNLVSVLAQTRAGQEVVLDADSHIFNYEGAGAAVFGGVQTLPVKTARGFLTPEQVREHIRPNNIHIPMTGLVAVENTHNRHGGTYCTPPTRRAYRCTSTARGSSTRRSRWRGPSPTSRARSTRSPSASPRASAPRWARWCAARASS